ncbi:MAG: eCIS core domain-containing protein [Flavobacteriales bacterium]
MSDVKVHYNSPKPAQLQAHAYAQGNQIHLASGQEKHLPHEAWHVVQQKQGRVAPTTQLKGKVNINDNAGLEKEADVMGAKALQLRTSSNPMNTNQLKLQGITHQYNLDYPVQQNLNTHQFIVTPNPIQLQTSISYGASTKFTLPDNSKIDVASGAYAKIDPDFSEKGTDTSGFTGWGNALQILRTATKDSWVAGHLS